MQTILIGDSSRLYSEAVGKYIETTMRGVSVEIARNEKDLLIKLANKHAIDLLVIDLSLLGIDGAKGLRSIRKSYPKVPLILTFDRDEKIMDGEFLTEFSIAGIISKNLSCRVMTKILQKTMSGVSINSQISESDKGREILQENTLTPREKEVLTYLVRGDSNKEIARALGLQVVTVKLHVRGICKKSGARNRTEAALVARENGWA